MAEFTERMNYNRNFIKGLAGFSRDEVLIQEENPGLLTIITIATWKDQASIDAAKQLVQQDYTRIQFDPRAFCEKLHISMERHVLGAYADRKD